MATSSYVVGLREREGWVRGGHTGVHLAKPVGLVAGDLELGGEPRPPHLRGRTVHPASDRGAVNLINIYCTLAPNERVNKKGPWPSCGSTPPNPALSSRTERSGVGTGRRTTPWAGQGPGAGCAVVGELTSMSSVSTLESCSPWWMGSRPDRNDLAAAGRQTAVRPMPGVAPLPVPTAPGKDPHGLLLHCTRSSHLRVGEQCQCT